METNQNLTVRQPEQLQETLYDPAKAERITAILHELLHPAYVLLFGKMAGKTPHSDTLAYDILVITERTPTYDWYDAKRYLKMKIPSVGHGAPYMNIYVYSRHDVEANWVPFFFLARREGVVLYSSRRRKFTRPRDRFDFERAAALANKYADTFLPLADRLTGYASQGIDRQYIRESAFATAQAAIYYYRTLFYVYHGFEAETCDVRILHHRMRTLSGELPLLFESDEYRHPKTLRRLHDFTSKAQYDPEFRVAPDELSDHIGRVKQLGKVASGLCRKRIGLFEKLAE